MNTTYYDTKAWYRRCDKVKARCRGRCEFCGLRRVQNVHHRTYTHFGHEPLRDLMGVCRPCHQFIHGFQNQVTIKEGSLADQGDRGLGHSQSWRDYLARCSKVAA